MLNGTSTMAAELGRLSMTQLQKSSQSQQQHQQQQQQGQGQLNPSSTPGSWMWNPKQDAAQDDEDSWEVRAFAEDTNNIMGTTWPPRSYTCTFCRREFRSAQALGGHMNVHRRDRARIHQTQVTQPTSNNPTYSSTASSSLRIPTQEFVANGGLCLLYSLPNPNGVSAVASTVNACMDSRSTLLSISPYPSTNNLISACPPSISFQVAPQSINSSICHSNTEASASISNDNDQDNNKGKADLTIEDLDLELRLGRRSPSPS